MQRVEPASKRQRLEIQEAEPDRNRAVLAYHQDADYTGLKINLLKSQMQKCIRRGLDEQAVYALASMANMARLFPGESRAQGIRTNALNRVMISALEDVGPADAEVVLVVLETLLPMTRGRQRAAFSLAAAVGCVQLLCAARKSRVGSWLHKAFHARNGALATAQGFGAELHAVEPMSAPLGDANLFGCLDDAAACGILLERCEKESRWPALQRVLRTAWRQLSEKRPAAALALAVEHYALAPEEATGLALALAQARVDAALIERLERHDYTIEILPCAIDKHTAAGRAQGKGRAEFVSDGALVTNEHPRFTDERHERLRQLYALSAF